MFYLYFIYNIGALGSAGAQGGAPQEPRSFQRSQKVRRGPCRAPGFALAKPSYVALAKLGLWAWLPRSLRLLGSQGPLIGALRAQWHTRGLLERKKAPIVGPGAIQWLWSAFFLLDGLLPCFCSVFQFLFHFIPQKGSLAPLYSEFPL